jgi:hypothetical protein
MISFKAGEDVRGKGRVAIEDTPGIIVLDVRRETEQQPRISAFIWGGKVKPAPTLPFGRWKGAA